MYCKTLDRVSDSRKYTYEGYLSVIQANTCKLQVFACTKGKGLMLNAVYKTEDASTLRLGVGAKVSR